AAPCTVDRTTYRPTDAHNADQTSLDGSTLCPVSAGACPNQSTPNASSDSRHRCGQGGCLISHDNRTGIAGTNPCPMPGTVGLGLVCGSGDGTMFRSHRCRAGGNNRHLPAVSTP